MNHKKLSIAKSIVYKFLSKEKRNSIKNNLRDLKNNVTKNNIPTKRKNKAILK